MNLITTIRRRGKAFPFLLTGAVLLAVTSNASAQLMHGGAVFTSGNNWQNYYANLDGVNGTDTNTILQLFPEEDTTAMAWDSVGQYLYNMNSQGDIYQIPVAELIQGGLAPHHYIGTAAGYNSLIGAGMAFQGGNLYVSMDSRIRRVNIMTGSLTTVVQLNAGAILKGLAPDRMPGILYATNDNPAYLDDFNGGGLGVIRIDMNAAQNANETLWAPYPNGVTSVQGLAGDPYNTLYLVRDTGQNIRRIDTVTGQYIPNNITNSLSPLYANGHAGAAFVDGQLTGLSSVGLIGAGYCDTELNSLGRVGQLRPTGSDLASAGSFELYGFDLPAYSFTLMLASTTPGFVTNPAGSVGNLCLGGAIGRYAAVQTNANGRFSLTIDTTQIPNPFGSPIAATPGSTWYWQGWYRDTSTGGAAVTNFTHGVRVTFQ